MRIARHGCQSQCPIPAVLGLYKVGLAESAPAGCRSSLPARGAGAKLNRSGARAHLEALGPVEVRMAVLHEKATSLVRAEYAGGVIGEWRWLIYPWAVVEDVGGFLSQMDPPPSGTLEAKRRLRADYGLDVPESLLERLLVLAAPKGHV